MPSEFGKTIVTAVTDALNEKYPNKVISNMGLCVAIYTIVRIGETHIHPGSPCQHVSVDFQLVMFRPFVGEVLTGTVVSCDEQGVRVSMGFFDEIHIPCTLLQEPSCWSTEEKLWFWDYSPNDQLFLDLDNELRFRVQHIAFRPPTNMASARQAAATAAAARQGQEMASASPSLAPAMQIIAGIDKPGLGLTSWWPPDVDVEEYEDED
eukprot:CAMPEP_0181205708 /NCGR_PEP_ID=MMETSP1096-20121128/20626_1 /TAXON_ID=156174 ORGANISM="Chrysochromulina ericina, Strain CCMP281" /NCGR_SAMPLE_ID=MMETSP1096 /ASSEMBLY_ACC=CAM_ASM_000453 /LENGTH=207 /DNA_ID=CAMNT_0023296519 /DNA_START=8 /DNA_END=631 /DNA_ORIENTATION=+